MAEKAIVDLDIKINAANSANTVKDLKTNLKSLKDELNNVPKGSEAFNKLSRAINDTEGKLGDLNDSFKTLTGSGVERASSSLGLLREGFANLDFEKVKIGLNGLRTALAATGIMLLVQGVTYLIQNFDELKESTGILGTIMRGLGTVIDAISEAFYKLTDAIGLTNSTLDKYGESIKKVGESTQQLLEIQNQGYDNQIAKLKALGKETYNLEQQKLKNQEQAYNKELKMLNDLNEKLKASGQNLSTEQIQRRTQLALELGKINNQIQINEIQHSQKLKEEYDKRQAEREAESLATKNIQLKTTQDIAQARLSIIQDYSNQEYQWQIDDAQRREELALQTEKAIMATRKLGHDFAQSLADLAQLIAVKNKRAAETLLKVSKALAITDVVINTAKEISAYWANSAQYGPYGAAIAIAQTALAVTRAGITIAKISSQKLNVQSPEGSVSGLSTGGASTPQPINQVGNTSTLLVQADQRAANPTQPMQPVKAYVVETEATETIKRVSRIEEKSKIN